MNLATDKEKVSYIIGEDIGNSFLKEGYDLDIEVLITAIRNAATGIDQSNLSNEEKNAVMQRWQAAEQAKRQAINAEISKAAKEEGQAFLQKNKESADVKETASGLQYKVIKEGDGAMPKATDTVHVHYHGTLLNGNVFDSSVQRGEPISFPLNQVIAGWTEGLQLMKKGSKYRLFIPSHLAYGDQSVGSIPAGSTLIFDVELLDIK
ncbi:MAG: FKBP-type peptidyl-prolyl cis-trans isomerase [Bacteroidales bacterium]|jgi:FKBP-type peptidyl-prolyl cis-trans isomerase|nr:FKBP-type peptidyl-prolyl cis-trans isomerase [Bacteroidales bacterium]